MFTREDLSAMTENLKTQRDELRVRLHLGAADARQEWEQLEEKWSQFETKARQVGAATAEVSKDVATAAEQLGQQLKAGYERIRKSL
jgi:hypothetical protein